MNYNPVNKEFYEKTKAFVILATKVLSSYLEKGETIPYLIVEKNKFERDTLRSIHINEPFYFVFLDRHKEEVESLPEYTICAEFMRSDMTILKHLDHNVGTWSERMKRNAWDYLKHFLENQLSQHPERLEFNLETFDHTYYDLERFIYNDYIGFSAFSPLQNFASDVENIDLEEGLRIRKITNEEKEQILDDNQKFFLMPKFDILHTEFVIELLYKVKKEFGDLPVDKLPSPEIDVKEKFNSVTTALRLFGSGTIGLNVIKTIPLLDVPGILGRYSGSLTYRRFWERKYIMTETKILEFKTFWKQFGLIDIQGSTPLSVAMRRFNYAYERENLEDKLVDYIVAFEALFFKKGERKQLKKKLSYRTARLLTTTSEEREKINEQMQRFYEARCGVVHGEKVSLNGNEIFIVEGYLRKSIRLFFKHLEKLNFTEIINRLDSDSLRNYPI